MEFNTEAAFWLGVGYIIGYLTDRVLRRPRWSMHDSKALRIENWQLRRIK